MRKKWSILLATAVMSAAMSAPAFAVDWLIDPSDYKYGMNDADWMLDEQAARYDKFGADHQDIFAGLATDREKADAAVRFVADYMEYDSKYTNVHAYYVIRDGKGVCSDYTELLDALLNEAGVECYAVSGWVDGGYYAGDHSWNLAIADGVPVWMDVTAYDTSGSEKYGVSETLWSDHFLYVSSADNGINGITAADYIADVTERGQSSLLTPRSYRESRINQMDIFEEDGGSEKYNYLTVPDGMTMCVTQKGTVVYILQEDIDLPLDVLMEKYPELND